MLANKHQGGGRDDLLALYTTTGLKKEIPAAKTEHTAEQTEEGAKP